MNEKKNFFSWEIQLVLVYVSIREVCLDPSDVHLLEMLHVCGYILSYMHCKSVIIPTILNIVDTIHAHNSYN